MARRIEGLARGRPAHLSVDGEPIEAHAGESLAAALAAAGVRHLCDNPERGDPRGMFCLMGVCQECVVRLDGRVVVACMEPVRDGMEVTLLRRERHP